MKSFARKIHLSLSALRLIPHIILMKYHASRGCIEQDIKRWLICLNMDQNTKFSSFYTICSFIKLMTLHPEYRNLFYYRIGWTSKLLHPLCRPMSTLYIQTRDIGPGLFIQHGFSTIISAEKIGRNCWINQQVTIGFSNDTESPLIGDNVTIYAGAKVIGKVRIGNNSIVGANAVVVKDVPANSTVVGIPACIVRRDGERVKELL